jgi:hypothetical protein
MSISQVLQPSTRQRLLRASLALIVIVLIALAFWGIGRVAGRYGLAAAGALITACATIVGVLITQLVAAWLATERAQVEALQAYLKEIGELLSKYPNVRNPVSAKEHDLRSLARAHTQTVLTGMNPARQEVVLKYLMETQLLEALGLHGEVGRRPNGEDERELDNLLQAYLDWMSQLLANKERPLNMSQVGDYQNTEARLRTFYVLRRLHGVYKRRVILFLYESQLSRP